MKSKYIILICTVTFGAIILSYLQSLNYTKDFVEINYVVTETGKPNSFDPLNADKTQNISVMRMLYSSPLSVGSNNSIISYLLETFSYSSKLRTIELIAKENIFYSDGTAITAYDIALAIARVAYFKPDFPVIKDIEGVLRWSKSKAGLRTLPEGIKVEGSKLSIKLSKSHANPLFRLCLEIFSVIPAGHIDLDTGNLISDRPAPSSGNYIISTQGENEIKFTKNSRLNHTPEHNPYVKINFLYKSLSDVCNFKIENNTVIAATELDFRSSNCLSKINISQVHWLPSTRFSVLRFNPNDKLFASKEFRQIFSDEVRKSLKLRNPDLLVERGLFSNLLPGHLKSDEIHVSPVDRSAFVKQNITLPIVNNSALQIVYDSIIAAAEKLGMTVNKISNLTNDEILSKFLNGSIPIIAGASGFWAQDPLGDIAMWFTPNLHPTMKFAWKDERIYKFISSLENETESENMNLKMRDFNRYLSEESVLLPVLHFRRLFITAEQVTELNLPQAVTSPAPWQLFHSK